MMLDKISPLCLTSSLVVTGVRNCNRLMGEPIEKAIYSNTWVSPFLMSNLEQAHSDYLIQSKKNYWHVT